MMIGVLAGEMKAAATLMFRALIAYLAIPSALADNDGSSYTGSAVERETRFVEHKTIYDPPLNRAKGICLPETFQGMYFDRLRHNYDKLLFPGHKRIYFIYDASETAGINKLFFEFELNKVSLFSNCLFRSTDCLEFLAFASKPRPYRPASTESFQGLKTYFPYLRFSEPGLLKGLSYPREFSTILLANSCSHYDLRAAANQRAIEKNRVHFQQALQGTSLHGFLLNADPETRKINGDFSDLNGKAFHPDLE